MSVSKEENRKTAIITGGGGALGTVFAQMLREKGYTVCLFSLYQDSPLLGREGIELYELDIRNENAVAEATQTVLEKHGSVDLLINNAGLKTFEAVSEISSDTWRNVLETNLTGSFLVLRSVLPQMLSQKSGIIINIASRAALRGYSSSAAYSASKAGLMRLTEALAAETAASGISVCALCPSTAATPDALSGASEKSASRFIKPEALAHFIAHILASPEQYHGRCVLLSPLRMLLKESLLTVRDLLRSLTDSIRLARL